MNEISTIYRSLNISIEHSHGMALTCLIEGTMVTAVWTHMNTYTAWLYDILCKIIKTIPD
jgi:hypothetical protein